MNVKLLTTLGITVLLVLGCEKASELVKSPANMTTVDFAKAATITPSYDVKTKILNVEIGLVEGVHAYAQGEQIGKPVFLVFKNQGGWKTVGDVEIPRGTQRTLGSSEKSVVLEGKFSLKATVEGGTGPIAVEVGLQICSDTACDRPRVHLFQVEVPKEKI